MRRISAGLLVAAALLTIGNRPAPAAAAQAAPAQPSPPGYWLVASDGGIFTYGQAAFRGSAGATHLNQPIVGMAATPSGKGYWLVARDGGIFTYGDAGFFGSTGGVRLNKPIVGMAATPTGLGYWLVASDGGIFNYGDAAFFGSAGSTKLNQPIVGMAATPSGLGYWLVASDGGIFSYGDAAFFGSTGGTKLNQPVVGMTTTPTGKGYWLVARDGGIFTYGDGAFSGSAGGTHLNQPILGMAATPSGHGYWLTASDGGIFAYGDAPFRGSAGGTHLAAPIVGMAPAPVPHGTEVAIFYYGWYGTPTTDGAWRHWDQSPQGGTRTPPEDIGSDFYPALGPYSSNDPAVLDAHMADIANAGINTVITSWWGQGSYEDKELPLLQQAAANHGLGVAVDIDPYTGRTSASVASDLAYLSGKGVKDVYLFEALNFTSTEMAPVVDSFPGRVFAETGQFTSVKNGNFAIWAAAAHMTGIYTYAAFNYEGLDFAGVCASARAHGLLCSPSVAPGFTGQRATSISTVRARANGALYDKRWMSILGARPDVLSITSYNEWHEGSQIEAATPHCTPDGFCYQNYEGAWGQTGAAAASAYMLHTKIWTDRFRAVSP
jgi:hypothetical protein